MTKQIIFFSQVGHTHLADKVRGAKLRTVGEYAFPHSKTGVSAPKVPHWPLLFQKGLEFAPQKFQVPNHTGWTCGVVGRRRKYQMETYWSGAHTTQPPQHMCLTHKLIHIIHETGWVNDTGMQVNDIRWRAWTISISQATHADILIILKSRLPCGFINVNLKLLFRLN